MRLRFQVSNVHKEGAMCELVELACKCRCKCVGVVHAGSGKAELCPNI